MSGPLIPQATLVIYGILLGVGGLMGYLKARSRPSLIAGATSGLIALITAVWLRVEPAAIWLGVGLAGAMVVVFLLRLRKTGKFMPAGLLVIVSVVVLVILGVALASGSGRMI